MNEQTLILTEHRMLPRIFDGVLTAIAWAGFAFFLYANLLMQFTERGNDSWDAIMASFNTVLVYLLVAAINGWLLILWYQYNLRRYTPGGTAAWPRCAMKSWQRALISRRRSFPR